MLGGRITEPWHSVNGRDRLSQNNGKIVTEPAARFGGWKLKPILAFLMGLVLAACVAPTAQLPRSNPVARMAEVIKQQEFVLKFRVKQSQRLENVAYQVLSGAVPLCGDRVHPTLGFSIWNMYSFGGGMRKTARRVFGLSPYINVRNVMPSSPAYKAGLRPGDMIQSVNGQTVLIDINALGTFSEQLEAFKKSSGEGIRLTVRRDGKEVVLPPIHTQMSCRFRVVMLPKQSPDASADGETINVSEGMMRFATLDEELALVVSHELAHNTMKHIDAKKQNAMAGAMGGLLFDVLFAALGVNTGGEFSELGRKMGVRAYSVEFEKEADYVGTYAMALAGFDIEEAPDFWRKMATISPKSITFSGTHPTSPERFILIGNTVEEIRKKARIGLPLRPEIKPRKEEPKEERLETSY